MDMYKRGRATSQYGYGILSLREKCARMFITFMEVFDDMCNLSDGVYLDGVEKGIIQGEARGIEKGRFELIKNSFNKFKSFDECINFFNITDKNEIKFLRENL